MTHFQEMEFVIISKLKVSSQDLIIITVIAVHIGTNIYKQKPKKL